MSIFSGKVYTVTGAASGMGRATSVRLAELGAKGLAISDVNVVGLEETAKLCEQYNTKVVVTQVDVRKQEQVARWITHAVDTFGRLDGGANVAGVAEGDGDSNVQTMDDKLWEFTMSVNLTGVMHCMRAQLPHLPRPGGSIVNIASTSGVRGHPKSSAYAASKHGVVGLTRSAAGEFGVEGIRVNAVLPGPIDTAIYRDGETKGLWDSSVHTAGTALKRVGKAEEVAKVICFLLSDDASYVTAARWTVDGGITL
ncbi:putative short chain dehydrogenase/ reductase [Delphinella strobiligena]|nr:putative short chain dehydrogenase/ reductase [Delphinella strobiligena]